MFAAVAQICSSPSIARNLAICKNVIDRASRAGAKVSHTADSHSKIHASLRRLISIRESNILHFHHKYAFSWFIFQKPRTILRQRQKYTPYRVHWNLVPSSKDLRIKPRRVAFGLELEYTNDRRQRLPNQRRSECLIPIY